MRMRTEFFAGLLALGLAPQVATALNLQLKPSVHLKAQYDDNVFRAPDGSVPGAAPHTADRLTYYGAGARLILRESLQELEVRGDFDRIDYAKLDALDYDRYLIGAQARLAVTSTVKLKMDAGRERRQESFAFRDDTEQGFITVDQAAAELRYAATPRWTGIARGARYVSKASRQSSKDYDLEENSGELGAEYRRNGYSMLGLGLRQAGGQYPNRIVVPGDGREKDYTQRSLFSRMGYTPSGFSDLTAQLAYTRRTHDDSAVRDFSGVTGRFAYARKFSGISRLRLEAYRDLYYVEDINANYVENLGAKASYEHRWSPKIALAVSAERYDSSYKGSPGVNGNGQRREDAVLGLRIGLDYQPFYRFSILPEYRYEQRESNFGNSRYDFSVIGVDLTYQYGEQQRR